MKANCFNRVCWMRVATTVVAAWVFSMGATGCVSQTATAGAPRSNVPRQNALSLAALTAKTVGGQVFSVAATGSMKPTLDESSVVTVEAVEFSQLRRGDIVIYRNHAGTPIIHRLYEQQGSQWLVLGDNNGLIDREAVTSANIVGRVCAIFYTSPDITPSEKTVLAQR
jgi:signal peptidase I